MARQKYGNGVERMMFVRENEINGVNGMRDEKQVVQDGNVNSPQVKLEDSKEGLYFE